MKKRFYGIDEMIHETKKHFDSCVWRDIEDTGVKYYYCENRLYALKFYNNNFAFVFASSPKDAFENYLRTIDKIQIKEWMIDTDLKA